MTVQGGGLVIFQDIEDVELIEAPGKRGVGIRSVVTDTGKHG